MVGKCARDRYRAVSDNSKQQWQQLQQQGCDRCVVDIRTHAFTYRHTHSLTCTLRTQTSEPLSQPRQRQNGERRKIFANSRTFKHTRTYTAARVHIKRKRKKHLSTSGHVSRTRIVTAAPFYTFCTHWALSHARGYNSTTKAPYIYSPRVLLRWQMAIRQASRPAMTSTWANGRATHWTQLAIFLQSSLVHGAQYIKARAARWVHARTHARTYRVSLCVYAYSVARDQQKQHTAAVTAGTRWALFVCVIRGQGGERTTSMTWRWAGGRQRANGKCAVAT